MMRIRLVLLCLLWPLALLAQSGTPLFHALPDGIEVSQGATRLRVTALSDSVLRVREAHDAPLPEDASWAVLPAARASHVAVQPEAAGFATAALRVSIAPDLEITVADRSGRILQQDAEPVRWEGTRFRVFKRKADDAHYFGLGDKPGPLDRAGQSYAQWNTDNFGWQESNDPLYKSIPFFIEFRAGRALGVLFDNTWRSFFDFGHELPDRTSFGAPDGPLDYYLIYGPEPKDVVRGYAWLTGTAPLPPLWALGFQQSRYSYESRLRLEAVADRLRADHIPADVLYLDIDYQQKNRPFTVDPVAFPDFAAMVKKLAAERFHLVLITDLHIADLPGQNYVPYDSGAAGDHFVKNSDGSPYVGPVWPGPSVFPDFTRQATRQWWGTLYKDFAGLGVSGFWNDMNEPAVFRYPSKTMPDSVQHRIDEPGFLPRVASHQEIHNVYGMENARATYDGLRALEPNERPFVLTRASYAGGQRYAATWTGDNSSTWNHLRQTTPQLLNLGLSGFAFSGADVGGFAGSPPPDLLTRWLELAAFQPIDRDHAAKGTRDHEPWVDGPEHEAIRRHFIEERYRLLPYLYTVAEEASRDGLPVTRPLFLEFPHAAADGHPLDLDAPGEFLLGPSLLIAASPSPEEVAPYEVHLPPGLWYDWWTGQPVQSAVPNAGRDLEKRDEVVQAKPRTLNPTLGELPVFVRAGAILPMQPLTQSTSETPSGPLTLRVYLGSAAGGAECAGDLYQDDGHSFNYQQGDLLRIHFRCSIAADGSLHLIAGAQQGSFHPWFTSYRLEVYGWTPGKNRVPGSSTALRQEGAAWVAEVPADPRGFEVQLQ
ncbi:glycoside hydrolase family 31 protein [Telmatobacter bradus]|uniref:glycoside hydrolase family 31 protein n=1 Tax=Telmatobacter bradus TaxID=474953 RepID=UPI003B43884F